MKRSLSAFVLLFVFITLSAQDQRGRMDTSFLPLLHMHKQQEYNFDQPLDKGKWKEVKPGLHAGFGSTDKVYFRSEVPAVQATEHRLTGWRGERLNAVVVVWSPDTIGQVRFVINDLKTKNGQVFSKANLRLQIVRNVVSNYPYNANDVSCGPGPVNTAYLLPDRLETVDRFDLPGGTVRQVWLSADIPVNTLPGSYSGTIEVRTDKGTKILTLQLNVQAQRLPPPAAWTFQLDLWQNPTVISDYYNVTPWSEEHKTLLKKHLALYADAGGKFITTYAVHSPWSDNSYTEEGGMIEWIKKKDNQWQFDYSIFDQYVQLAMDAGITKAITIYTPIPWGERFRYLDEATGKYEYVRWVPTSPEFKTNFSAFLTDLKAHLKTKGWLPKTYLGINENAMEQTLAAINVIREHAPDWKITYAGDWHEELDSLLDDYSCVYGKEPPVTAIKNRSRKKQTTTYYICCTPPKPNTFVFSPPVEGRWLGWYALASGYDGLLRWAYDAWPADPVRDARHVLWPAGDCFMIYPGGASSIRFEKMREGISDFEKLKILRTKAAKSTDPATRKMAQELDQHLQTYLAEKTFAEEKLWEDLQKGRQLVDGLSEQLK